MDHLCELPNDTARRKALDALPPTLNDTYERILQRINNSNKEVQQLVRRSLRWLMCSFAPLSSSALCEAVTIEIGDTEIDRARVPEVEEILRWCSSLVRRSTQKDCLELAHFTVQEFLSAGSDRGDRAFKAYRFIPDLDDTWTAKRCLTYLSFEGPMSEENDCEKLPANQEKAHTLRQYAVLYWRRHAQNSTSKPVIYSLTQKLLHPSKQRIFVSWAQDLCLILNRYFRREAFFMGAKSLDLSTASPLHFASMLCLPECCEWLIQKGCRVNQPSVFGTPLECVLLGLKALRGLNHLHAPTETIFVQSAAQREMTVRTLINSGANVDRGSVGQPSPIYIALTMKDKNSCIELLRKGALLDQNTTDELTKVHCHDLANAIWEGIDVTSIRPKDRAILLNAALHSVKYSKDESLEFLAQENQDMLEPFLTAAAFGELAIVKKIVQGNGININAVGHLKQRPALHLAASNDHVDTVKFLIEHGADCTLVDSQGRSPLHACLEKPGAHHCLDFLLHLKIGIGDGDADGLTAWHLAALGGNINALNILNDCTNNGQSQLHLKANDGRTPLHCAAQSSSKETVVYLMDLLSQGMIHNTTSDGLTALHYAVKTNSLDAVQCLIRRELNVHAITNDGSNILHCAVTGHSAANVEIIQFLLQSGVDPCQVRKDGMTPIHLLLSDSSEKWNSPVMSNEFEAILRLLSQHATSLNITDEAGLSALHHVCKSYPAERNIIALRILLQNGADPNLLDRSGKTALEYVRKTCKEAIESKYCLKTTTVTMIRIFLNSTTDMHFLSTTCADPQLLLLALMAQDEELAVKILEYKPPVDVPVYDFSGMNSLEAACHYGCSRQLLEELVKRSKVELNTTGSSSRLLVTACISTKYKNKATVTDLLDLGFDPNEHLADGRSALMSAAEVGNLAVMETLINHGADVSARDKYGWSIIHYAIKSGSEKLWQFLQHFSTDWNAMIGFSIGDNRIRNATALHLAASIDGGALEFLLKSDMIADINHVADQQYTALCMAAEVGIPRNVDLLLEANANATIGCSPLHIAAWKGHLTIVKILANRRADLLLLQDSNNLTAELVARSQGHVEVASFLKEKISAIDGDRPILSDFSPNADHG